MYGFKAYRYNIGLWVLCMEQKIETLVLCGVCAMVCWHKYLHGFEYGGLGFNVI